MGLEYILDDVLNQHYSNFTFFFAILVLLLVVAQKEHWHFGLENLEVFGAPRILFYSSDEPPTRISTVKPWVIAEVQ